MNPSVWKLVVGKEYTHIQYTLCNYAARKLKNRAYPGLIHVENSNTSGIIYKNIDEKDIVKLDEFEGQEYQRIELFEMDGIKVHTYLYTSTLENLLLEEWDYTHFIENEFEDFISVFGGWDRIRNP